MRTDNALCGARGTGNGRAGRAGGNNGPGNGAGSGPGGSGSGGGNAGNTGSPGGNQPDSRDGIPTLKERWKALGNLPRFFALVWKTSPGIMVANSILRIVRSAIPVSILYVGKLIIDQVVLLAKTGGGSGAHLHTTGSTQYLWELVALEFGLAILSDGLSRAISLLDSLLGDKFGNFTSIRIMRHAAELDLDQFEDSTFYDKLERARQQTTGRTILLSQVLGQVQ